MTDLIDQDKYAALLARIDNMVDTGVRAARYDGDASGGSSPGSHPERLAVGSHRDTCPANTDDSDRCTCGPTKPDPISERAVNDYHELQRCVAKVTQISAAYPSITAGQFSIPGITPCPKGRCTDHWAAGLSVASSQKPRLDRCARCHRFKKDHGEPTPPLVLRAVADLGGPKGPLGQAVYDHPNVIRAWDASGWVTKPVIAKRTA